MQNLPTRPCDVDHRVSLPEIAERYLEHARVVVYDKHGIGEARPPAELIGHALAALAFGHALADRALASRWVCAADALAAGATSKQVADAMGLDDDELQTGLGSWADSMVRLGHLTPADRTELLELLVGARILCAHADEGGPAHWLQPGERCDRRGVDR